MTEIRHETKDKEIRNLLFVIASGVLAAFALVLSMLYSYNPSGSYLAGNVLLSPDSVSMIKFNDTNPRTGTPSRFIFDQVQFSYLDLKDKHWKNLTIEMSQYAQLYQSLRRDRSVDATDEIRKLFNHDSSKLILNIQAEASHTGNAVSKPFLEVNFANHGDYYRIELHEENSLDPWAYFHHPEIYKKVFNTFIPSQP